MESVKELKEDIILRGDIVDSLKKVYDIERLASKISYGSANGRDLISLKNSTAQLPGIKTILSKAKSQMLKDLYGELDELQDIYAIIDKAIVDEPPISVKEGGLIKLGYDEEIDRLKTATTDGKNWVLKLEAEEREKTGICLLYTSTISDKQIDYAKKVEEALQEKCIRVSVDDRSEKIGYKIREAQLQKVPYMLVIGDKEIEANAVGVRSRTDGDIGQMKLDEFVDKIVDEVKNYKMCIRDRLISVVKYIRIFGVPDTHFKVDLTIARGLDYYTRCV